MDSTGDSTGIDSIGASVSVPGEPEPPAGLHAAMAAPRATIRSRRLTMVVTSDGGESGSAVRVPGDPGIPGGMTGPRPYGPGRVGGGVRLGPARCRRLADGCDALVMSASFVVVAVR